MSPFTKFRTCFIIFILLLSSLSVFVFNPKIAKAEESTTSTTLYFHDAMIEDQNLSDLIGYYNLEKLQDLLANMNESDLNESFFSSLEQALSSASLSRSMDQSQPTKTNDSEYPPTIKTIIDMCRKGNWDILSEVLLSYFAPFQGIYVYNGNEAVKVNGDVKFNIYFSSPPWYIWNKDTVNVSFSILTTTEDGYLQAKFKKSGTIEVKRKLLSPLQNPVEYEIPVTVDTTLEPGDIILAEINITGGEKPFINYLNLNISDLNQSLEELGNALNKTGLKFLSNIGETFLNLSDLLGSDFADLSLSEIIKKLSSSFIYDSVEHKSSLTIPGSISGEDENVKTYYLHDKNMSEELPTNNKPSQLNLKGSGKWDGPALQRSKILKEASASLYIDHLDLIRLLNIIKGKIKVTATLFCEDKNIASSQIELSRNTILDLLQKPREPTVFTFTNMPQEIPYGKKLSLEVTANNGTKFGLLGLRRNAKLLYDSTSYPSSLTVKFVETDHIKITPDKLDTKVALGGSINYNFNITSDSQNEDIQIKSDLSKAESDKWDITISPEKVSVPKGGQGTFNVVIKSKDTEYDESRYGDHLKVTFTAEGLTGKTSCPVDLEISKDAVEYNIGITADPEGQKINHGENGTYQFTIKNMNTGFLPDDYTIKVSSEHKWNLNISKNQINELAAGKEVKVDVTLSVPKDTKGASSDALKFTVTSGSGKKSVTLNITTTVVGPNILESLYDTFDSAAKSLGLDSVFGSYAPHFLAAILFIIIFFMIIVLAYFLTRKYVNVICLERVKDITPEGEAKFEITIQNPYKYKLSYETRAEEISSSQSWNVSLDTAESIVLEPKQSKTAILTVKPTSFVKSDDWAEVKIIVKALEKQKTAEISTVTTIKDAKPELYITSVFHWPKVFKKGDLAETSFKLENKGNVSASNLTVVLYVNGKEKNKVENVTIPAGGYADIKMPWIAVKGKNEVNIVVE